MSRAKQPDIVAGTAIASAVTSLAFPPVVFGDVSQWLGDTTKIAQGGVLPEFDLEIWAAEATNLTNATLWGLTYIAGQAKTTESITLVDFANNEFDLTAHGLETGDDVQFTTTDTLPTGLALLTTYYVIKVDANSFSVATTLAGAFASTILAIADVGAGTHDVIGAGTAGALLRVKFLAWGLLGVANDGAITLTEKGGYSTRVTHRPRTFAYAVSATLSAAKATTITVHPVRDTV